MITHLLKTVSRLGFLSVAFLFVALPEAPALTLEEAVARAWEHSSRVQAARAGAEAAGSAATAASWSRGPRLGVDLGVHRSNNPVVVFSDLLNQGRFTSDNLGSFDPSTGFDLSNLNNPDPLTNWGAMISLFQPIWTGGAISSRVNAGRAQADAAEASAARTEEEVAFQTEGAFRRALLAQERLALLRDSYALARTQAARVESLWTVGLALQSNRQALEAHVHETEAALASAQAESVEARSLLGLVTGGDGPVWDRLEPIGSNDGSALPSLAQAEEASQMRADIRAAEGEARAAEAQRGLAKAQYWPDIGVTGNLQHNSNEFLSEGGDNWFVGLHVKWSVDGGIGSQSKAASRRARAAALQAESAREQARHEVRVAHTRIGAARERLESLDAAVRAAESAYALVEKRHEEGLATTLELTESQNTLTRTRLQQAVSRHDLAMARAALRLASGIPPQETN